MNFIGEKCAACGIEITADDSVIVCPDCGSPHHRDCYLRYNSCANEGYHATGQKWKRTVVELKKESVICKNCGFSNPDDAEICQQCGSDLNNGNETKDAVGTDADNGNEEFNEEVFQNMLGVGKPYLGFDPEEDLGGATVREVSDFVSTNTIYYLPIFKRMKDFGSKLSFNITCLFFPALYFANRKMWSWAILATIVSVALSVPSSLLLIADYAENDVEGIPQTLLAVIQNNWSYLDRTDKLFSFIQLAFNFLFCFIGNRLYFRYVVHSVKKIKKHGEPLTATQLGTVGGVKPINMLFIILIKYGLIFFTFSFIGTYLSL